MQSAARIRWLYLGALMAVVAIGLLKATPSPDDDFHYQMFIEALAGGNLDLRIPGFHGMNMLAVPLYWVTGSKLTAIYAQLISGVLLPLTAYLAASSLLKSPRQGILFATAIALAPFLSFGGLRGWMVATYNCLFFLTIWGAVRQSKWTWFTFGMSIISLPFSVALIPLLMVLSPKEGPWWKRYRQIGYGLIIPVVYVIIQFLQAGQVNVGLHTDLNQTNVFQGPYRMFLNFAHTLQIIFSVHNYYFVSPANTGHGNMMQTTPILIFTGLAALFAPKKYFSDRALPLALVLGAVMGIGLNIMLDHMDHFYMETGLFFIMLAALPYLARHPLWVPVGLATLHFQWFYFFLQFREVFQLNAWFFLVPAFCDAAFLLWCVANKREVLSIFHKAWGTEPGSPASA